MDLWELALFLVHSHQNLFSNRRWREADKKWKENCRGGGGNDGWKVYLCSREWRSHGILFLFFPSIGMAGPHLEWLILASLGALTLLKTSTDKTGNLFCNLKEQILLNYFLPSILLPLIRKDIKLSVQSGLWQQGLVWHWAGAGAGGQAARHSRSTGQTNSCTDRNTWLSLHL